VSTEFETLGNRGRDILGSCLVRPTAPNRVSELQREKLVPKSWLDLIETSYTKSSITNDANRVGTTETARTKISGRLGNTCVFSCTLVLNSSEDASIDDLFVHQDLNQTGLERRLLAEIVKCCDAWRVYPPASIDLLLPLAHSSRGSVRTKSSLSRRRRKAVSNLIYRISPRPSTGSDKVEWDEYAEAYDTMCAVNLAYQENLARFRTWLSTIRLDATSTVCDVGAGTGNYVLELVKKCPSTRIIHLDSDPMMNRAASQKYRTIGANQINFCAQSVLNADIEPSSLDLIVCVNALYTFGHAQSVLSNWYSWLKPGGLVFVIDLGRPMDVWDWSRYILGSNIKTQGLKATAAAFIRGRKAIGQNRLIRRMQERGDYWVHSTDTFEAALSAAQLEVLEIERCYRGDCDLAICSKESL
jgi:ubiquinone/menaquinone biosynthesis C-methylase UbiE